MSSVVPISIDAEIIESVVANGDSAMTKSAARAVAALSFSESQQDELHRLLHKNNAGTMSAKERAMLEGYTRVGQLLNLLRTKARHSLARRKSS